MWRPTQDQQRQIGWAIASVGILGRAHIDTDDLRQMALLAVWRNSQRAPRTDGSRPADGVVARSAVLSYLQRTFGKAGSARRAGADGNVEWDSGPDVDQQVMQLGLVDWDTPEALLSMKQSLLGLGALPELQQAVLQDLIDGDESRLEIAQRHGCSCGLVDHARRNAAKIIALGHYDDPYHARLSQADPRARMTRKRRMRNGVSLARPA